MRVGYFIGKQVVMSNKDWRRCLKRVNIKKIKEVGRGRSMRIIAPCPFCKSGDRDCTTCPLGVFAPRFGATCGCVRMFRMVAGKLDVTSVITLFDDYVSWDESDDKAARKILEFIHTKLLVMTKRRNK